jgi:hypothetical protein
MTRAALASILVPSLAVPATADLTITQSTTGKGMGMSGTTIGATYIAKGSDGAAMKATLKEHR